MTDNLTVGDLKELLRENGATTNGKKAELLARLAQLDEDGTMVREWLERRGAAGRNEVQRTEFEGMKQQLFELQEALKSMTSLLQNSSVATNQPATEQIQQQAGGPPSGLPLQPTSSSAPIFNEVMSEPLVQLSPGILNGTIEESRHGRKYAAFLGVPYAKSPIGNLRFKNPEPAGNWNGIRQARTFGNVCPQLTSGNVIGNEDCLFLNVYTPVLEFNSSSTDEETKNKLFPVMFWIHGGGFHAGKGNHARANYLLDKDVILVTINYRLEVLGFLSIGNSAAPGNYGLKDQVLALKWVQINIRSFGGDPKKVTLFGQSAGGASVALHALSKASNGLFHQYIIQSGSPLGTWAYKKRSEFVEYAKKLAELVSCNYNTTDSFVDCLRTKSVESLLNTRSIFGDLGEWSKIGWCTTDEPDTEDAFLTDSPKNLMEQNQIKDLPFIYGSVTAEGLVPGLYTNSSQYSFVTSKLDQLIPFVAGTLLDSKNKTEFLASVKKFYFNNSIDFSKKDKFLGSLTNYMGDGYFIYPSVKMLEKVTPTLKSPIYYYSFCYLGTNSVYSEMKNIRNLGVPHGGELAYLFPFCPSASGLPSHNFTKTEKSISGLMVDLWTSFAINGKPISKQLESDDFWVPYNPENTIYLQIGNIINNTDPRVSLSNTYFTNRMHFWSTNAPS